MSSRPSCLVSSTRTTTSCSRAQMSRLISRQGARSIAVVAAAASSSSSKSSKASPDTEYDAIVIGSGMGGLTTASQLAAAGQRVAVLERYKKKIGRPKSPSSVRFDPDHKTRNLTLAKKKKNSKPEIKKQLHHPRRLRRALQARPRANHLRCRRLYDVWPGT